jgi:hypothetical protein
MRTSNDTSNDASVPVALPAVPERVFAVRVAEEVQRRTANADTYWRHVSPTDTRTRAEIDRDMEWGSAAAMLLGTSAALSGVMGGIFIAAATHPAVLALTIPLGVIILLWSMGADERSHISPFMLSSRFRNHLRATTDAVYVPCIASDAYDTIRESATLLSTLSAPDAAIEYAINARSDADESLVALGHLADTDDNDVWLSTTAPYKRLMTLAAEVTVLAHLSRDRLALPAANFRPIPAGVTDAADVAAYMLEENTYIANALNPAR